MPPYFEQGYVVRQPAWHEMAIVLDYYPGRVEGMRLAGHDTEVIECPVYLGPGERLNGWKALRIQNADGTMRDGVLAVTQVTYTVVQNSTGWDVVDMLADQGAKYETGITLKGGAVCLVTFLLDEPTQITGDDSVIMPYGVVRWTHDGSGSLTARATSVRAVCSNTDDAGAAEARQKGTHFTFRHTKNVHERIDDAKMALKGIRLDHEEYVEAMEELAGIPVTEAQRELFVTQIIPMPTEALISDRVKRNVENARTGVRNLFDGPTIPEAHKLTAYGLRLAGVEYFDHVRPAKSPDTMVGRQLLRTEPAKVKLTKTIREVVAEDTRELVLA
jgi:phage/plasmid-like protein (TIGR03299 family)